MKKTIAFILFTGFIFFNCSNNSTNKDPAEINTDIVGIVRGSEAAHKDFAKTVWIFYDPNHIACNFEEDSNLCTFYGPFQFSAEYFIAGNIITFKLDRLIEVYKNFTADTFFMIWRQLYAKAMRAAEKELAAATDETKKQKIRSKIADLKESMEACKSLAGYTQYKVDDLKKAVESINERLKNTSLTQEEREKLEEKKKFHEERIKNPEKIIQDINDYVALNRKNAVLLESFNPITGTVADDKKSFTVKKMPTFMNGNSVDTQYKENLKFIKATM